MKQCNRIGLGKESSMFRRAEPGNPEEVGAEEASFSVRPAARKKGHLGWALKHE